MRQSRAFNNIDLENFIYFGDILEIFSLRLERPEDYRSVEWLTYQAFLGLEHSQGDEALLVNKMRSIPAFVPQLDYVACVGDSIVGNIMYTKSKIVGKGTDEWETLTFGPLSVLPEFQRRGIGAALVDHTIQIARKMGMRAILIFGHENYYPKFGFKEASLFGITTKDGKNFPAFMALPLSEGALNGINGKLIYDDVYENFDITEVTEFNRNLIESLK